jgi:hypothetical protein
MDLQLIPENNGLSSGEHDTGITCFRVAGLFTDLPVSVKLPQPFRQGPGDHGKRNIGQRIFSGDIVKKLICCISSCKRIQKTDLQKINIERNISYPPVLAYKILIATVLAKYNLYIVAFSEKPIGHNIFLLGKYLYK